MDIFIKVWEIIGTIAFAISGSLIGIKKEMDVFGTICLGFTTAISGGVIRDILLGITPPSSFINPLNAIIAIITSLGVFIFLYIFRHPKAHKWHNLVLLVTDSAGLAVFTVCGIKVAIDEGFIDSPLLVLFLGVITGVGGGILRDVFAGDRPYVFVKHIYACASLVGGTVTLFLWHYIDSSLSMLIGFLIIITIRFISAKFNLSLPKIKNG